MLIPSFSAFDPQRSSGRIRVTKRCGIFGTAALVRLDIGELDHHGPLLGFVGDQLAKVSGRTRKHRTAQVGEPRFHIGVGEASADLLVEFVNAWPSVRRRRTSCSPRNPARTQPRSGSPATHPSGARRSLPTRAVYRFQRIRATMPWCRSKAGLVICSNNPILRPTIGAEAGG